MPEGGGRKDLPPELQGTPKSSDGADWAAGLSAWTNAGKAGYNGLQLVWRRPVTNGWGFDFNYTWSHSLDNVSGAESDTNGGTARQRIVNTLP